MGRKGWGGLDTFPVSINRSFKHVGGDDRPVSRSIKVFICEVVCVNDDVSILASLSNMQFDQYG